MSAWPSKEIIEATSNDLQIIGAAFGLARVTPIVIGLVDRVAVPQSLSVAATDQVFGDSWPGVKKSLTVVYRTGETGAPQVAAVREGNTLSIRATAAEASVQSDAVEALSPQLTIFGATFGPADTTAVVKSLVEQNSQSLSLTANDKTFGDPWPGVVKSFAIVAAYTGQVPFLDIVTEGSPYFLKFRPPLRILSATWGLSNVTAKVQATVYRRTLTIQAANAVLGDGWPGVPKSLVVVYQYGTEQPQMAIAAEGATLNIDYAAQPPFEPSPDPRALYVVKAAYGRSDVTAKVTSAVQNNVLALVPNDALFGDSWPGVRKSFSLTYSWGPTAPLNLVVAESTRVELQLPQPALPMGLVSLAGLFSDKDVTAVQAGTGMYWGIDSSGQIIANVDSAQAATNFTIRIPDPKSGQVTLYSPTGASVVVGADGLLRTQQGGNAAVLVPSLTTTGSIVLSVVGQTASFAAVTASGAIAAAGSDIPTFDTSFALRAQATQAGFESLLRANGIDLEAEFDVSVLLLKLVWDLTGGFFLAIGLGPLINQGVIRTGLYALIQQSERAMRALQAVIDAAKNNPGTTAALASMLVFTGVVWDEGLMWKIFRMLLNVGGWWLAAKAATELLKWAILPEAQAAELVVSFAIWAYTTVTDALAYANSVAGQTALVAAE